MVGYVATRPPRVLLIGDSITLQYADSVRNELRDVAVVKNIPENGHTSAYVVKRLEDWIAEDRWYHRLYRRWSVIQFNAGLHDLIHNVPAQDYRAALTKAADLLKQTKARVVFAETTFVPAGTPYRPEVQEEFRKIADDVMRQAAIPICPLRSVQAEQIPVDVHFTANGSAALGRAVAECIKAELAH